MKLHFEHFGDCLVVWEPLVWGGHMTRANLGSWFISAVLLKLSGV